MKTAIVIFIALAATAYVFFIMMQPDDPQYTYLNGANKLLSEYQIYSEKMEQALKAKSLQELVVRKKELEAIADGWAKLQPTPTLRGAHDLMLEALSDDGKSLELVLEGIKNRDNTKIKKAIEISDQVAVKIKQATEEFKRLAN